MSFVGTRHYVCASAIGADRQSKRRPRFHCMRCRTAICSVLTGMEIQKRQLFKNSQLPCNSKGYLYLL